MLKTTNGGETWSELNTNTYGWFRSVNFTDANTGYTVGDFGIILKTTNGGTNWTQQYGGTAHEDLKSVKFVNANTGYVAGDNGTMLKTTNGGVNWVSQTPPKRNKSSTADLNSVYFIDANTGWIVGANGTILKTTNGGVFIYNISNEIPGKYVLHQNYPNPFNPSTTIIFDLPESGFVSLIIYDVLGREVVTLLNKELKAGSYTGVWNAGDYNSGVYFYRLRAGDYVETRKCLLIK
jgi:photosystem II stability/assembly factor-like uncharacterized protein